MAHHLTSTAARYNPAGHLPPGTYPAAQANGTAQRRKQSASCVLFLHGREEQNSYVSEPASLVKVAISGIPVITVRLL